MKHKNITHICKECDKPSVQMNYCTKHYKQIVLPRFEKYMQFLLIKKNLSQSTIFLYVSDLVKFPINLFQINDTKTFNEELLKFINSHSINFLKKSTMSRTRGALKSYLFFLGKEHLMLVIDRIFIKQKQKSYDSLVSGENTLSADKYWDKEKIVKDFIKACEYTLVNKNDILNKDDKNKITKYKQHLMEKHGFNKNLEISSIGNPKTRKNLNNKLNKYISTIVKNKPDVIPMGLKSRKVAIINSKNDALRNKMFVLTLFMGGLRASESVWSKVKHLHTNHLEVLGKGFKFRKCILNQQMIFMLRSYIRKLKKNSNSRLFIFDGEFNEERDQTFNIKIPKNVQMKKSFKQGLQMSMKEYYYIKRQAFLANRELEMIGKVVGVHLFPHSLRHSLATHLINEGLSLEIVQGILGHVDPKTTLRYAKVKDETKEKGYLDIMGDI